MSILIKGMEMPSRCNMCQLRDLCYDYYICRAKKLNDGRYLDVDDVKYKRHIKCPLVEVPTPHGRLIDEEAIYNNVKSRCNNCHIRACAICGVTRILNDIRTAPTIIEAEVSDNA